MSSGKKKGAHTVRPQDKLLTKFTLFFFDRPRKTALIWLVLAVFGIASYTTLLKREGFPSINIPVAIVSGTYFANDPAKVDEEAAKPISDLGLKQKGASTVQTHSAANFFTVSIQYDENIDAHKAAEALKQQVKESVKLPPSASVMYNVPYFGVTGGDRDKLDLAISFYDPQNQTSTEELTKQAEAAAAWLKDQELSLVEKTFIKRPFEQAVNPVTNEVATVQRSFDRYGKRENSQNKFHNSVIIGVTAVDNADVIKLDKQIREALTDLRAEEQFEGFSAAVSASFAPSIEESISELQRVLLEGLLAVLIVGSIVIAVRASFVTVISMVTVLVATLGLLYLIGYSLNVITLFALILSLSLIVDDTIIMVEAIDAARRKYKNGRIIVEEATRKVSRAMVAATLTACLSFAPLLFVSGILGSFIRAIPVTIIAALLISLVVALLFIPFFARFLLLGKNQVGEENVKEVAAAFEAKIAQLVCAPMLWARRSRAKLFAVGITAVVIGFGFIAAGGFIAQKVVFNIFPASKDTNGLVLTLSYPPGTDIAQAQTIAQRAEGIAASIVGENFVQASYYNSGGAQNATLQVEIIPYGERDITAPQLTERLQKTFDNEFKEAQVTVGQADVGPPASAFTVQIRSDDRAAALRLANDVAAFLENKELVRPSGKKATTKNVSVSSADQYARNDGVLNVRVSAGFDGDDTTTLVNLAQDAVKKEFTETKVRSYGLPKDALNFDIGQESENQDSFKTLAIAFPLVILVIYLLLAFQFRSLLQPLLIIMAIPFSVFGVMLGLYLTDNPISFFSMLGFFALIGLSIKNTILLTDFANQARRSGMGPIDAAVAALGERFRPLIATSITAVVSLIPLAVTSPFWQGLAVVLIFGLLSSTFLVVTIFPYYYLGAEYLRTRINRRTGVLWTVLTIGIFYAAVALQVGMVGILAPVLATALIITVKKLTAR